MAKAGDTLEIEMAGKIVFTQTAADTNGDLLKFDYFLAAGKETGSLHMHPKQEERFRVVKGTVTGEVDGEPRTAKEGDEVVMPAGIWHVWRNDGDVEAQLDVENRPALRTEDYYEVMAEVEVSERGIPNPMHAAVVMKEYRDEQRIKRMENPLIKNVIFPVLRLIGKARGYSAQPGESKATKQKAAAMLIPLLAASLSSLDGGETAQLIAGAGLL